MFFSPQTIWLKTGSRSEFTGRNQKRGSSDPPLTGNMKSVAPEAKREPRLKPRCSAERTEVAQKMKQLLLSCSNRPQCEATEGIQARLLTELISSQLFGLQQDKTLCLISGLQGPDLLIC